MIHELTDLGQKHARTIKRLAKRVGQSSEKMGEALVAGAKRKFGSRSKLLIHNVLGKSWAKVSKVTSKVANAGFKYAPYKKGTTVLEGITASEQKYVRVFAENTESKEVGRWMMKAEDIAGLSPKQIKNKFSLEHIPTHITDVTVPPGIKMRTGISGKVPVWGDGGGQQFQILEEISDVWYSNARRLVE